MEQTLFHKYESFVKNLMHIQMRIYTVTNSGMEIQIF